MLRRYLRTGAELIQLAWRNTAPDPLDVLVDDLGLPLDDALLRLAQHTWCKKYRREPLEQFVVHDALHYLLDAAPTPKGEALVVLFQRQHLVYDRSVIGAAAIVFAGAVLKYRGKLNVFSKERAERKAGMAKRLQNLIAEAQRRGVRGAIA